MADEFTPEELDSADTAAGAAQPTVALAFLADLFVTHDFNSAWEHMHPDLKLLWIREWATINQLTLKDAGHDTQHLISDILQEGAQHPLWGPFSRDALRDARSVADVRDFESWAISCPSRVIALDTELLYFQQRHNIAGEDKWDPREREGIGMVLRCTSGKWLVLHYGSAAWT